MAVHVESFRGEADFSEVESELRKTGKAFTNLDRKSKTASKGMEAAKFAAQGAGGKVGELAGRAENLGRAFGIVGPMGAAFGVTIAAVAVSMVGAGVAAFKLSEATIGLIQSVDELVEKTKEFRDLDGFGFTDAHIDQIREADAALDSLTTIAAQMGLEIANTASPAVERVTRLLVAAGIAGLEAFQSLGDATSFASRFMASFIDGILGPFRVQMQGLAITAIAFQELMGGPVSDSLRAAAEGGDASALAFGLLDQGMVELEGAAGNYLAKADALIGRQLEVNAATRSGGKASKDASKSLNDQIKALEKLASISTKAAASQASDFDKLLASRNAEMAHVDALALQLEGFPGIEEQAAQARLAIHQKFNADVQDLAEETAAKRDQLRDIEIANEQRAADVKRAIQKQILDTTLASVSQTLSAQFSAAEQRVQSDIDALESKDELTRREAAILERLQGKKKRIAIANFVSEKASAIASVVIGTARNAVAWGAPPPIGLGPFGPPAALFLGATQLAAVAAQPPPKFHTGGVIEPLAPDEQGITAQAGESVLTQQATRDIGRDGVNALNRGGGMDGGTLRAILEVLQRMERERMRARNADSARFGRSGTPGITRGFGGL